jgi:hypothetical protein
MFLISLVFRAFVSVFGEFYKAENPVRFWSIWNPNRVKMSVGMYKAIRSLVGKWVHYPFTIAIFFFWGLCDDVTWLVTKWVTGIELFPFGLWFFAIGSQSFVVLGWKKISKYLPSIPKFIARPLTLGYVVGSVTLVKWLIF